MSIPKGIEADEKFASLLRERFGVTEFPEDAPPLVDPSLHLKLARVLAKRGYTVYVFVVASHWPAEAGKKGTLDTPESYEVAFGLRKPGPGTTLATWRIRVGVNEEVDSMAKLFAGADWQEREQYDLLGVRFRNHPDLRRLMMPDDWEGHPLRKDYAIDTACSPWR